MKPHTFLILMGLLFAFVPVTSAKSDRPVITINKLQLTQEELQQEFSQRSPWAHEAQATPEDKEPEWATRIIERELLVQQAQELGLDREAEFMRTIERFWKEALIKLLLERKTTGISDKIHVYAPEIETRYEQMVREAGGQPMGDLAELKEEIRRGIRQEKETEAMEHWIQELRQRAKIQIDYPVLAELAK